MNALPSTAEAFDNLVVGVRARVIFEKLAAHGMHVQTEEQAQAVMDTIDGLRAIREQNAIKQASHDPFARVRDSLQTTLAKQGLPFAAKQAEDANLRYQQHAASVFASDPTIFNSVLAVKAAEAEEIRAANAARS